MGCACLNFGKPAIPKKLTYLLQGCDPVFLRNVDVEGKVRELKGVPQVSLALLVDPGLDPVEHAGPVPVDLGKDHLVDVDVGDVVVVVHLAEKAVRVGAALVDSGSVH